MNEKKQKVCKSGAFMLIIFLVIELLVCLLGAEWGSQVFLRDWRFEGILTYLGLGSVILSFVRMLQNKRDFILPTALGTLSLVKVITLYSNISSPHQFYGNFSRWYGWDDGAFGINYALALPDILSTAALVIFTVIVCLVLLRSAKLSKVAWIPYTLVFIAAAIRIAGAFDIYTPYFNAVQLFLQGISLILLGLSMLFILNWALHPYMEPAHASIAYGEKYGYIRPIKHILLLLFTFGIWQYIWIYRTTAFLNTVKGVECRNPTTKLLLCMFIPFYNIYWMYQSARRVDHLAAQCGVYSEIAKPCLLCAFFIAIVPPILIQEKINTCVQKLT